MLDKENTPFFGILVAIIAIFFYAILGAAGALSVFVIILLFVAPSYFIMDNFNLEKDEKLVFSFFISVGIFPVFSYWLGVFISFKLAILITFVLLVAVGFCLRKVKGNRVQF